MASEARRKGGSLMKQPKYIEGRQAIENFEEGMKTLFKVPKGRDCTAKEARETRFF